ncbi:MAG: GNAT family N-acetyltransferase [Deltaproteobacteria bacterium]|nr:GNAT family N-acetyltransferase [Deltaproteobacteria bacterium]
MITIVEASSDELIAAVKGLFMEYADSLGFDLSFQNFDDEMKGFPGQYSPPVGCLYVALADDQPIGCVGVRRFEEGICEMKRLYVRPGFRGKKAGTLLAEAAMRWARAAKYKTMRLDTVSSMVRANDLYKALGFKETSPYRENPVEGAIFMELDLENCGNPP